MKTHQNAANPLFMGGGGDLSTFYNNNRIKFYIAFVSMILSINQSMAQVTSLKVGSSPTIINPSAALEVESSSKGVLLPRVALTGTTDVTTILSPTASMLVYNTATAGTAPNNVTPGYYYWSGAAWTRFTTGTPSADWTLTGNAGSVAGTNFMGTTDAVDFVTKTNNIERLRVTSAGNVGIGTTTPTTKLEINNGATAGAIKIVDGTQGDGKVLTSDANGVGTWTSSMMNVIVGNRSTTQIAFSSSGNNYLGSSITLNPGKYLVYIGLLINNNAIKTNAYYFIRTSLSSSNTNFSQVGFSFIGSSLVSSAVHTSSSVGAFLNFVSGSVIIQVSSPITLYLWNNNSFSSGNSSSPSDMNVNDNSENYIYAIPVKIN